MFCYKINSTMGGELYRNFIDILIKKCDSYIFTVPNMEKMWVNERNKKYMSWLPLGYTETVDPEEHNKYLSRIRKYIDIIKPDIVKQITDTGYLNQVSSNEMEVFLVKTSERTKVLFKCFNGFSEWRYPDAPEDPCFISKGKCVFQCISHENFFYLFSNDKIFTDFFKRNNINVNRRFFGFVPKL